MGGAAEQATRGPSRSRGSRCPEIAGRLEGGLGKPAAVSRRGCRPNRPKGDEEVEVGHGDRLRLRGASYRAAPRVRDGHRQV